MKNNSSYITRIVISASVFLLAVNGFLGVMLTRQSAEALHTQIRARMLDVSSSAAALLDGDALETLEADDAGTEPYEKAMDILRAFQDNVELSYIYGIRDMGGGKFTFTIDPTVADPADFGEPVEYTDALYQASLGTPSVDETSYSDRWGRFYSAYSPVFDSRGRVAGIVGVDFDAVWYDRQIERHRNTVFVVSVLSLLVGALVVFMITGRIRKRFLELNAEVEQLTEDMAELSSELRFASGRLNKSVEKQERAAPLSAADGGIDALSGMIRSVHEEMTEYISDAHVLAYTDPLTGVGNRSSYFNEIGRINRGLGESKAPLSIAVFDINGLKAANDEKGHEYGDNLIRDAAFVLKTTFQTKNVYRTGGDEFAVLLENTPSEALGGLFESLDTNLSDLNRSRAAPLSISRGVSSLRIGVDTDVNEVFRRADRAMYDDKARYYAEYGDRRINR